MVLNRTVLAGAGGLVIGLLIGFALSASGRSALEAQLKQQLEAVADLTVDGLLPHLRRALPRPGCPLWAPPWRS